MAYWRPLANQAYFRALGETILAHPQWVTALHVAMLALASVLIYRALQTTWSGAHAAAAASFPLLADSIRSLACWPSNIADLGAMVFLAVAIHERSRRRLATGLLAAAAALLCKESAVVGVLLLPFVPDRSPHGMRARLPWAAGAVIVTAVWAVAYLWVRSSAGLELPHGLEKDPSILHAPLGTRLSWALWNSLRASFSLGFEHRHMGTLFAVALATAAAAFAIARNSRARSRWSAVRPWAAWGAVYGFASWLALAPIFPLWSPYRSLPGSVGFGIGAVALAGAVHPALPLGIAAARLALFAMSPGTPARIHPAP